MSYEFYAFLHVVALMVVFSSLGAVASHMMQGGTKEGLKNRKILSIAHGVALLVAFVAGFGLIAKRQYSLSQDHWLYIKILCWLVLGVYPMLMYKKMIPSKAGMAVLTLVAAIAIGAVYFLSHH